MTSMTASVLRPWRSKCSRWRSPLPRRLGPGTAAEQLGLLVDRDADGAGVGEGDGTHGERNIKGGKGGRVGKGGSSSPSTAHVCRPYRLCRPCRPARRRAAVKLQGLLEQGDRF